MSARLCIWESSARCSGAFTVAQFHQIAAMIRTQHDAPFLRFQVHQVNLTFRCCAAGMAVFDTMRYVKADVSTVCVGLAASMGAFLLASGHQVGAAETEFSASAQCWAPLQHLYWPQAIGWVPADVLARPSTMHLCPCRLAQTETAAGPKRVHLLLQSAHGQPHQPALLLLPPQGNSNCLRPCMCCRVSATPCPTPAS